MDDVKISLTFSVPGAKKVVEEVVRKHEKSFKVSRVPALQVINLSFDAYNHMRSEECPADYKPSKKWKFLSSKDRLEHHLNSIATSLGGKMVSYNILDN
jgi:hypothetical protein